MAEFDTQTDPIATGMTHDQLAAIAAARARMARQNQGLQATDDLRKDLRRRQLLARQAQAQNQGVDMTPEQLAIIAAARARQAGGDQGDDGFALASAIAKAMQERAARQTPETGMFEQSMSGVNEGIAGMLGAPVDLMTGALNLGAKGINAAAGTQIQPIENPAGGSGTFRDLLSPTISETPPQNVAQRYGRRIGQEAGAMAIPGGVAMRGARSPLMLGATEAASAVGSGVSGQTSQEFLPGNQTADMIASMIGGLSPIAVARGARPSPQAPSMDDLRGQQTRAYDAVDQSQARLSQTDRDGLIGRMQGRTADMDMDEFLHPRANRPMQRMDTLEPEPRIADIEQKRRLVGRDVAGSLDPSESMIGQGMKDELDTYLTDISRQGNLGPDATDTLAKLQEGRAVTQKIKKSEMIGEAVTKAERRAASTGTGGNEVNAIRQNIRAILDNPKKRRGFSADEIDQMESIVRGTPTQNALRLLGRLSPTSGALPLGGFAGTMGAVGATGNPLFAVPSVTGMAAKALAESGAKRQIKGLGAMVRNGGQLPKKALSDIEKRLMAAITAQQAASPVSDSESAKRSVIRALIEGQKPAGAY